MNTIYLRAPGRRGAARRRAGERAARCRGAAGRTCGGVHRGVRGGAAPRGGAGLPGAPRTRDRSTSLAVGDGRSEGSH